MMSSTIEMLVNKQTIYRWPFNRLCYQAVIPDPMRRCCFPPAAVPRVLPRRPSLPSPAEFQLLQVYVLLPPPHRSNPVPEVLAFPQFAVWRSRLWCLSSFVCALSLCQLASRGAAKWHPHSLSHSRHVLHLLTHGE